MDVLTKILENKNDFSEENFWEYVESNNGFSKCPNCYRTPRVMRFGKCKLLHKGNVTVYDDFCTENIFYVNEYTSPPIENINCCEHLYDFNTKKRYILASKYLSKKPIKEFHPMDRYIPHKGIKVVEYVEYDLEDPYGEQAKIIDDYIKSKKELEEKEKEAKLDALLYS